MTPWPSGPSRSARGLPVNAMLNTNAYDSYARGVANVFPTRTANVDTSPPCDSVRCLIRLVDVADHTACQLIASGQPAAAQITFDKRPWGVELRFPILDRTKPLLISITCY
jgi:hypothetical protein